MRVLASSALTAAWIATLTAGAPLRSPASAAHFGGDLTGLCLSYGCGTAVQGASGVRRQQAVGTGCHQCRPVEYNLPTDIDRFCLPTSTATALGGIHKTPRGWITLASAAWTSDQTIIEKAGAMSAVPRQWNVHAQFRDGLAPGDEAPMDIAECKAAGSRQDEIEVMMVAYVGAPAEVGHKGMYNEKSRPTNHGDLAFEPVLSTESYKEGRKFELGKKKKFWQFRAKEISDAPISMRRANFHPKSGYVVSQSTTVNLAETHTMYPDQLFELRIHCGSKKCDVTNFHGCYHIMCRELTTEEMGMQEMEEELRQKMTEGVLNELKVRRQEMENEQKKEQERLDREEHERLQKEKDEKYKEAAEFLKRQQQQQQDELNEEALKIARANLQKNMAAAPAHPLMPPGGGTPLQAYDVHGHPVNLNQLYNKPKHRRRRRRGDSRGSSSSSSSLSSSDGSSRSSVGSSYSKGSVSSSGSSSYSYDARDVFAVPPGSSYAKVK